jgi:hypothetical protein
MDDDVRTTGMGLWTDARQMLEAAELVSRSSTLATSSPTFYLMGHGLEVALKAYLRSRGHSLKALRAIGHDIESAAQEAMAQGLGELFSFSPTDLAAISALNQYYKAKHFEYRVTGYRSLPPTESLLVLGNRLLAAIRPICEASVGAARA